MNGKKARALRKAANYSMKKERKEGRRYSNRRAGTRRTLGSRSRYLLFKKKYKQALLKGEHHQLLKFHPQNNPIKD